MDEILAGGALCLGAATLYLCSKNFESQADALKSATHVKELKDLAKLLNSTSKAWPFIVVVSGRVGSDTPITCKYSDLRCVIVEEMIYQNFLKRDDEGKWKRDYQCLLSTHKEVPWYLDDGTGRVHVVGACSASDFYLSLAGEIYKEPCQLCEGANQVQDLKMLGIRKAESALPIGKHLTVVGEVVKDDTGSIHIQKPRDGPFYVSSKTIDWHIEDTSGFVKSFKYAAIGIAAVGVILLAGGVIPLADQAIKYIIKSWRPGRMIKRAAVAAKNAVKEERENRSNSDDNDRMLCTICLDKEYNSVFVPCGHMCCCFECSSPLKMCPLCRGLVNQIVRTFRS